MAAEVFEEYNRLKEKFQGPLTIVASAFIGALGLLVLSVVVDFATGLAFVAAMIAVNPVPVTGQRNWLDQGQGWLQQHQAEVRQVLVWLPSALFGAALVVAWFRFLADANEYPWPVMFLLWTLFLLVSVFRYIKRVKALAVGVVFGAFVMLYVLAIAHDLMQKPLGSVLGWLIVTVVVVVLLVVVLRTTTAWRHWDWLDQLVVGSILTVPFVKLGLDYGVYKDPSLGLDTATPFLVYFQHLWYLVPLALATAALPLLRQRGVERTEQEVPAEVSRQQQELLAEMQDYERTALETPAGESLLTEDRQEYSKAGVEAANLPRLRQAQYRPEPGEFEAAIRKDIAERLGRARDDGVHLVEPNDVWCTAGIDAVDGVSIRLLEAYGFLSSEVRAAFMEPWDGEADMVAEQMYNAQPYERGGRLRRAEVVAMGYSLSYLVWLGMAEAVAQDQFRIGSELRAYARWQFADELRADQAAAAPDDQPVQGVGTDRQRWNHHLSRATRDWIGLFGVETNDVV